VVVVNVPFSDISGTKRRPALVVSTQAFHRSLPDLVVCPISSQPRFYERPGPGDHPLEDWRRTGLRYPSTVRISKILAVDRRIVGRIVGAVSARDLARVGASLRSAMGLGRAR
jgi:mRNA interferase MazF